MSPRKRSAFGQGYTFKLGNIWYYRYRANGKQYTVSSKSRVRSVATALLRQAITRTVDQGQRPMTEERRVTYADLRQGLLDYYSTMKKKSLQTLADGTETIWGLAALDKFFEHTSETPSRTPAVSISDDTAARFIRERRTEGVSDGT